MKRWTSLLLTLALCASLFVGCGANTHGLDPKHPLTLTMWHNFGGDMQQTMDELIDEFNSTVGRDRGIIINVTAISASKELQEKLSMIVNGDPGAPAIPNLFTCYPKTALHFQQKGFLANLDKYFTSQELDAYVSQFVEEGRFGDGGLYVFPFAKSTEVLFLNQTLFDRFSAATGVTLESLATFEGIADAAERYRKWTDAQTPDVLNDGKTFYTADSWFNLAQAGMRQQGEELFLSHALALDSPALRRIWDVCFSPSSQGAFALFDGYSSDLSKTGDIVCSTGSTAGVLFYGDSITYADNTMEQVTYTVLPYPVLENGQKMAIQRGNGLCAAKGEEMQEYASALFLKWFTAPERNLRFISSTGYLPVTKEAFDDSMQQQIQAVENPNVKKLLTAATQMYREYDFFVSPVFEEADAIEKSFEAEWKARMKAAQVARQPGASDSDTLNDQSFQAFCNALKA